MIKTFALVLFQGFCYGWGSAPNPVLRQEGEGTAFAVPETLGLPESLHQGLPGCFASSVLSLDSVPALDRLCWYIIE